uniref:DNA polymerase delta subunit 3 n=1 Tax=Anopheles triannulatus TaxID=58253 RepID=A0A2M4AKP3_9DIPT
MDSATLKTYHREIGHLVFDANEKVSVRKISNLWNIDSQQSVEVLQKWIDDQKESVKLSQEFLIRGKDKNGNVFMTLANEKRAAKITSKYAECSKMLYSVEAASDVRPLNVSLDRDFAVINLRLETEKRELVKRSLVAPAAQPAAAAVKQEQKPSKMNGMFSAMASKQAKTPVVAKDEKPASPPPAPVVPTVKAEPQTPTTKTSPKKSSPKKDTKKQANGKGSISSFFSSKPDQTGISKPAVKSEPESPSNPQSSNKAAKEQKKPENSRKRTIDEDDEDEVAIKKEREEEDEEIPSTPQAEKRDAKKRRTGKPLLQRKTAANPSKKSRIYAICDSSSEDEAEATEERREEERSIKFEQEPEPEPMEASTISPEKPIENDSNSVNRNHRGKVKKLVTKTFMTADGFMETVKEYEMVSEDESQEAVNGEQSLPVDTKLSAPNVKQVQAAEPNEKKKATPPTPRTKQGSIMSFFAKK